jgi:protein SCO1
VTDLKHISIAMLATCAFLCMSSARAEYVVEHRETSNTTPSELQDVGIDEHRGAHLNLDLDFQNASGQTVKLGEYFNHGRPVLMAMVYFDCPNLCNMQLDGYVDVFKKMNLTLGKDFDLVAVSMDPHESAELAATKLKKFGNGWNFLVGRTENVHELAKELGFKYKWDPNLKQFSHASATYLLTPTGEISRYIYGIDFAPETLRLGLVEAGKGLIGTVVDQIVLFCFQFNPNKNKYVLYSFNLMRIGGLLTILLLSVFLIPPWWRERQRRT